MRQTKVIIFLILIAFFSAPTLLLAQVPSTVPDSETAGAEQARFEQELEKEKEARPPAKVPLGDDSYLDEEPIAGPEADILFELKKIVLSGNESISTESLAGAVTDQFLGTRVNLYDIREIARKVKNHYRNEGFIAAYVYVPPQTIADGIVEIAVIEGRVGEIQIVGNRWYSAKVLKRALRIASGSILFYEDLRSGLSRLNRKKDIKARATLKPGAEQKTTDVQVNVEDKFPVHLSADVNNLGSKNTGETRWGFTLAHHNLLGQMDKLQSRFQLGKSAWAIGGDYSIPIHETGTLLRFGYNYSAIDVGGPFEALGVEGDASTYTFEILQPVYSSEHVEAVFKTGFDWKTIHNEILGFRVGDDELRILNLGLNLEFTDKWGKTYFPNSFHFGFSSFLGGSNKTNFKASRVGTGGQFFIYRSSLLRYHRLPFGMMYAFRGNAQLTNDRLVSSEQIRMGGAFSVRGYSEGEYLADYGGYITNELYIPSYFFPKDWKLPFSEKNLRNQIQGTVFFDVGHGRLRKALVGESQHRTLAGGGIGVRVHLFDRVFARLQWATPTGSDARSGDETAFYYGVSAEVM